MKHVEASAKLPTITDLAEFVCEHCGKKGRGFPPVKVEKDVALGTVTLSIRG
jgi:hypothetical protein